MNLLFGRLLLKCDPKFIESSLPLRQEHVLSIDPSVANDKICLSIRFTNPKGGWLLGRRSVQTATATALCFYVG
jgi:hypothetical protein